MKKNPAIIHYPTNQSRITQLITIWARGFISMIVVHPAENQQV